MKCVEEIEAKIKELDERVPKSEDGFPIHYDDRALRATDLIRALRSSLQSIAVSDVDAWIDGRTEDLEV